MARRGTKHDRLVGWLPIPALLVLLACGSSAHRGETGQHDGSSQGDDASRPGSDASSQAGSCQVASDCVIVSKGCCGACVPSKDVVRAVLASQEAAAIAQECPDGPVACGPCPDDPYDPLTAKLRADCRNQECVVVDLREEQATACTRDEDCALTSTGCCGSCGADPSGWLALHEGTTDPLEPVCDPIPPCAPCDSQDRPEAFCAQDHHCAVRAPAD